MINLGFREARPVPFDAAKARAARDAFVAAIGDRDKLDALHALDPELGKLAEQVVSALLERGVSWPA